MFHTQNTVHVNDVMSYTSFVFRLYLNCFAIEPAVHQLQFFCHFITSHLLSLSITASCSSFWSHLSQNYYARTYMSYIVYNVMQMYMYVSPVP